MSGYLGAAGFFTHDANIALLDANGNIEGCYESERFCKEKHASKFRPEEFYAFFDPSRKIVYNEDWGKRFKHGVGLYDALRSWDPDAFDQNAFTYQQFPTRWAKTCSGHPFAHASAAFMTRPESFAKEDCVIVTCDGVGETQTMTIMDADLNILHDTITPKSVGYLYAAFTVMCGIDGLRYNNDEYVIMGLSSYGKPTHWEFVVERFEMIHETETMLFASLFQATHKKFYWTHIVKPLLEMNTCVEDAAASLQRGVEEILLEWATTARKYGSKLCYSGGVAQNILANTRIAELFDDIWVDVNPGDGGSALGAAAWAYRVDTGKDRINWQHPFLGNEIEGELDPEKVVAHILNHKVCGIANGRAEYSPRAYGNRSLIADVRYDVKDTVNEIKQRQKYRPFAPAILEEHAHEYFEGKMNPWMQFVATAKHPYSSVTHVDGTARVQLVPKDCKSVFRQVIECYYEKTGVPMLLNTSLNIRGMPMVNDEIDAQKFEEKYGVKVFTS